MRRRTMVTECTILSSAIQEASEEFPNNKQKSARCEPSHPLVELASEPRIWTLDDPEVGEV
jgi:hypothetical protein